MVGGFGDVLNGGKGAVKDTASYMREWEWIHGGYEDRSWKYEKKMTRRVLFLQDILQSSIFAGQRTGPDLKDSACE